MGLLEYEEMSFLLHYARMSGVFVDCGANIGIYSLLLGKICQKGFAIEPSTDTYEILERNLQINDLDNVMSCQIGVGDKAGTLYFTKGLDAVNHIVEDFSTVDCEQISVDTLDAICAEEKDLISIIKIDVEGHEREVLRGALEIFSNPLLNVVIMETFGSPELTDFMREKGFTLYVYEPRTRTLSVPESFGAGNNGIFNWDIKLA